MSASTKRNAYVVVRIVTAVFSSIIGTYFATGHKARLPYLQSLIG